MGFSSSKNSSQGQSQQTSNSSNLAYPGISTALSPVMGNAAAGTNAIRALLGLDGGAAQTQGFDNFRNSSGYDFIKNEGVKGIDASNASKGLLNSGSALKAITGYSSNLANNFLSQYLAQLSGLSQTGISAANTIGNAGQVSSSQGTSTNSSTGKSSSFTFGS